MSQLALPFLEPSRESPRETIPAEAPREPIDASSGRERARRMASAIRDATGRAVALHVTDNKRVLISQKLEGERLTVRIHHVFLRAEPAVVQAMARYVHKRDSRSGAIIDAFLSREQDYLRRSRARRETSTRPRGLVHDLREILDEVARGQLVDAPELPRITWGRRSGGSGRRRSIQLGTYEREESLIRIHPALDREWVPRLYVGFIVYHEHLHHLVPPVERGGRLHVHTAEFRALERRYVHYDEARRFEKENLNRLLRER